MKVSYSWEDYKIIKASNGLKLEKWKDITLLRPDPIVIWNNGNLKNEKYDAIYHRSSSGGGYWENINNIPSSWQVKYKNLTFNIKQMGFKHTGLFPEQAINWDRMIDKIKNSQKEIKVLNLFAYTGGATVACLSAGASVTHVDSSKGMNEWAKENVKSSGLENKSVRFLVDDVVKFVEREIRRNNKYDAIIMDPPSYGRGPNKEVWKLENNLKELIDSVKDILADDFAFVLINSYTTGFSQFSLNNLLRLSFKDYKIVTGEIGLPICENNLVLPCGVYGKITRD